MLLMKALKEILSPSSYEYVHIKPVCVPVQDTDYVEFMIEIRRKVYERVRQKTDEYVEVLHSAKPQEVSMWLLEKGYEPILGSPGIWSRVKH